jgi:hypothetical protein
MLAKLTAHLENQAANLFPAARVASEVFPDSIGAPCPETGELYGHKWFFHVIPADVIEKVKAWSAHDNAGGASYYENQANAFLSRNGLDMRITKADSKPAPWTSDKGKSGHHYRITLSRKGASGRLTFDFWGSISDAEKGEDPSAYDVLAAISADANCPDKLADWCSEYGEDMDSIKARQTFNRCNRFAQSLRAFFSPAELDELSEIN